MSSKVIEGFEMSALDLALRNLGEALRVAGLVKEVDTGLIPSPMVIVLAEIRNAERHIKIAKEINQ